MFSEQIWVNSSCLYFSLKLWEMNSTFWKPNILRVSVSDVHSDYWGGYVLEIIRGCWTWGRWVGLCSSCLCCNLAAGGTGSRWHRQTVTYPTERGGQGMLGKTTETMRRERGRLICTAALLWLSRDMKRVNISLVWTMSLLLHFDLTFCISRCTVHTHSHLGNNNHFPKIWHHFKEKKRWGGAWMGGGGSISAAPKPLQHPSWCPSIQLLPRGRTQEEAEHSSFQFHHWVRKRRRRRSQPSEIVMLTTAGANKWEVAERPRTQDMEQSLWETQTPRELREKSNNRWEAQLYL